MLVFKIRMFLWKLKKIKEHKDKMLIIYFKHAKLIIL